VLVVDDEVTTRSKVTRLVRSLGFQARGCPSRAAALRFLRAHPGAARLVLADLAMPRMDGGEFAERVKDLYRGLPIALMASAGDPHADDLLEGYADLPFLQKPVALGPLAELLLDLLGPPTMSDPPSMGQMAARWRSSGQHRVP
jgi:two-component system, cell cycle sensor histidine kinase and response regulator CckA